MGCQKRLWIAARRAAWPGRKLPVARDELAVEEESAHWPAFRCRRSVPTTCGDGRRLSFGGRDGAFPCGGSRTALSDFFPRFVPHDALPCPDHPNSPRWGRRGKTFRAIETYQRPGIPIYDYVTAGTFEGGDFDIIEPDCVLI